MEKFEVALLILGEVLEQRTPFSVALKNTFAKESVPKEDRPVISGLVGCELRHHLLFLDIVKNKLGFAGEFNASPICLAMANYLFYKKFDQKEINKFVCERFDFEAKKFEEFLTNLSTKEELIDKNIEKGSELYLSYRYNTPTWLVRMWIKHFGRGTVYKILKANYHSPTPTFGYLGDLNDLNLDTKDFVIENNLIKYVGEGNVKNTDLFNSDKTFLLKRAIKEVIDGSFIHSFSSVAIYQAYASNFYLDFIYSNLKDHLNIDLMTSSISIYSEMKHTLSKLNYQNVKLYESNPGSFITCLSEKVDTFFILPKNSNFDLLKTTPDYFHLFDKNTIDDLIEEEKFALEEAKDCVNDGGQLIYIVPTLNKKETRTLIREFLLSNPRFSLVEEKQYFPFDKQESSLYIAKLIKLEKTND